MEYQEQAVALPWVSTRLAPFPEPSSMAWWLNIRGSFWVMNAADDRLALAVLTLQRYRELPGQSRRCCDNHRLCNTCAVITVLCER